LLRIVAGLLRPASGECRLEVGGREVPRLDRRRVVGYASPELHFYDELTVAENLRFACEARGEPAAPVPDSLRRVGLEFRSNERVAALSSGMKQRLRLAFAILHRPPLLLLDEPGSHLDDAGRRLLREIVGAHARDGLVLLATNDDGEKELGERRIDVRGRGLGGPA
jgi:heme exporter protein A